MKFTKEEAIERIKASYVSRGEKTDLERTIREHVEHTMAFMDENSEMELDEFVTKCTPFVETALGLARKVGSDAVSNYKTTHPEQKPQEVKTEPDKHEPSELEKRLAALEAELNENKRKSKIENVKTSLLAKMKEKGIKDDEWAKSFVDEVTVTEDFDVEAKADSFLKLYNKSKSSHSVQTPGSPASSGGQNTTTLDDVAQYMKNQREYRAQFDS